MSDLDEVEFYWENYQLDEEVVFRLGIDTPFSARASDDLEMGGSAETPILLEKEVERENFPVGILVFKRPTRPPALLRNFAF